MYIFVQQIFVLHTFQDNSEVFDFFAQMYDASLGSQVIIL